METDINKTYLFLIGEDASKAFEEGGIDAVVKGYEANEIGYETITYHPATETPASFASKLDGWWGFVELTPEEFDKL